MPKMEYDRENDVWYVVETMDELQRSIDQSSDILALANIVAKSVKPNDPEKAIVDALILKHSNNKAAKMAERDARQKRPQP